MPRSVISGRHLLSRGGISRCQRRQMRVMPWSSHQVLGLDVIRDGTRIFDAGHRFEYDVAPACSGIRSLSMMLALTTVYSFMSFGVMWKRSLIVLSSFPLAVAANVARLLLIII